MAGTRGSWSRGGIADVLRDSDGAALLDSLGGGLISGRTIGVPRGRWGVTTTNAMTIKQGDTVVLSLAVTDDDDAAIDLTGATLTFHLRAPGATVDTIAEALVLTAPASGTCVLTLTAAQTAALAARRTYSYEVECVDASGSISTPVEGLIYVAEDFG